MCSLGPMLTMHLQCFALPLLFAVFPLCIKRSVLVFLFFWWGGVCGRIDLHINFTASILPRSGSRSTNYAKVNDNARISTSEQRVKYSNDYSGNV
jgi:hypothetical protein